MVMANRLTWCILPGKENDLKLKLTLPIPDFRDCLMQNYLSSNVIRAPFITDMNYTNTWFVTVTKIENTDRYSVTLCGEVYNESITAKANLSVEYPNGHKMSIGNEIALQTSDDDQLNVCGYSNEFTVNTYGMITIHCVVVMNIDMVPNGNQNRINDDTPVSDFKEMLDNAKEYHSDVVLQCEDGQVDCHRSILSLKSSYFKVSIVYPSS